MTGKSEEEILLAKLDGEIGEKDREMASLLDAEKRLKEEQKRIVQSRVSIEKDAERLIAARSDLIGRIKAKEAAKAAGAPGSSAASSGGSSDNTAATGKSASKEEAGKSDKPKLKEPEVAKAAAKSPSQIDLSWDAAPKDSGAVGYNVYRDGVFLKSVTSTSLSQSDLKPDTSYCYSIASVDAQGNESEKKQNICTKTLVPDGEPPTIPASLTAKAASTSRVELAWNSSSDNIGVKGYNVYKDGDFLKSVEGTATYIDGLKTDTRSCYVVTGVDAAGNESTHSEKACVKTQHEDTMRPTSPSEVTISELAQNQIDLSWGNAKDDTGVVGYNIYQDGVFLKAVGSNSAFNMKVESDTTHCYSISATDSSGNESRRSRQVCMTKKRSAEKGKAWGGTVWAGGINKRGQLGIGSTADKVTLVMIESIQGVARIAAADEHTLALKADGTVWAWGRNDKGQLGIGSTIDGHSPVQVTGLSDIVDVAVGNAHSLALKADGTVWAWGRNYYGQLGDGTQMDRLSPVQVKGLKNIIDIAAGWYHTVALGSDGTVWAWGWNRKGQLGIGEADFKSKAVKVEGLVNIEMVTAGMEHTAALKADGTVWTWGLNEYGQLGTGSSADAFRPTQVKTLSEVESVSAGIEHTVVLKKDGTVWTFGANRFGQAGSETGIKLLRPVVVKGMGGVKEIAGGGYHTVALKSDGTLWAWGWRSDTRYASKEAVPAQISGITGVVDIAAGKKYSLAIKGE